MRIKSIQIQNLRSIKEAGINTSVFNILVGQNNHGKTNFCEAIRWFFDGPQKGEDMDSIRFGQQGDAEVFVEIEFDGAQRGAQLMKAEVNKTKILGMLNGADEITIKRSSLDPKKRKYKKDDGGWADFPTGFDNALNDFLPKLEYVDTRKYYEDVGRYSKTSPIGMMLSGVLTTILEKSSQYQDFRTKFTDLFESPISDIKIELENLSNKVKFYLEKQFPDCTKVTFEVAPPIFEDLLKNFDTTVDDGIDTTAAEKGDGMQRALMLAILQSYADFRKEEEEAVKSFVFLIDEAELHLHPSAQRKLKKVLLDLADRGDQIFLNTHSSVLVVDDHPNQTVFKAEKNDRETSVTPILGPDKPYVIYELLGGSPADLLLPKNFLIVEGKSELEFLRRVIRRIYPRKPELQIISASGDVVQAQRSIHAIEQAFRPLNYSIYKDKTVILLDRPNNPAQYADFLTNYPTLAPNSQVKTLPVGSLEEYYPAAWRQVPTPTTNKVALAIMVGDAITQEQFETDMPMAFETLQRAWELAYN